MKMKFEFFVAAVIALVMIGCGTNKQLTTETGMLWIEEARHLDSGSVISEKMPDGEYLIDVKFTDIKEQVYDGDTINDVEILKIEGNPCVLPPEIRATV